MDALRFLAQIESSRGYRRQILHVETICSAQARYAEQGMQIRPALEEALASSGITRLYTHQVQAVEAIREGKDVVIATGTASGKSLCYNIPVIETVLGDPQARALYLYPTKALAQDQLRALNELVGHNKELKRLVKAGTYDGDTPAGSRKKVRESCNIILSNPDMLHAGILPGHPRWVKLLGGLRFVVIDELHSYRGIFGSNVANVLRRLLRLCDFYHASPQFIACSATIANPRELAEKLTGRPVELIEDDGAPRGQKYFVFWNPPETERGTGERLSPNVEAHRLLVKLVHEHAPTIVFTQARVVAELIYRYARDALEKESPALVEKLRPYRGGYLPSDRREIEKKLFSGELLGVTATNALELGIDVGTIDACIIVGFPGTIASLWQQAGRAGRASEESIVFFVTRSDPIDQFLGRHPEYLFQQNPEHAIIWPDNPYILVHHLMCAAYEMPLSEHDSAFFGPLLSELCALLAQDNLVRELDAKWYWASEEVPARNIGLRTIPGETFSIVALREGQHETIGDVEWDRAPEVVHPGAVYLHGGESYLVRSLDFDAHSAEVEPFEADYFTRPMVTSQLQIIKEEERFPRPRFTAHLGDVQVTRQVIGFSTFKTYTMENLGRHDLDMPPRSLETKATWLTFSSSILSTIRDTEWLCVPPPARVIAALDGLRNLLLSVLTMNSMCDRLDIGGIVSTTALPGPALFIYDRYHGGLGFAQLAYDRMDRLIGEAMRIVDECPCDNGCPSCVANPLSPGSIQDINRELGTWAESKAATLMLLYLLHED